MNVSLWEAISSRSSAYPELADNLDLDVVIIGGGITGMTAAFQLIKTGKRVAILEAHQIGGVTTSYSTGNLYIPVQPFYQKIFAKFGLAATKSIAQARKFAIDYIEKNIQSLKINCDFARRPWFGYTLDHERISLAKEVDLFQQMEIPVEYVNEMPLKFKFRKAVRLPDQARFNPLQYVIGMADHLARHGCQIFENTRVTDINEKNDVCVLKTANAQINAKKVFMATHTPIGINLTQMYTAAYRSYVVAVRVKDNKYPEGHFWDLDRPPHATCTHAVNGDFPALLMVAGSHHKVGQDKNMAHNYQELEKFLGDHFDVAEIAYQWSAQHYQSADDVPYIGLAGRGYKHTYLATGYFADGLIYGTLAGMLIADAIMEKENPLSISFQARRFDPIASLSFLLKENANVMLQYLKDYPVSAKYDDLKPGQGKVVEINREKIGVSRDANNQLHAVSAVCTHMKCIVGWNNAEQTWDCPCHGSRFTCEGKVIEGPAKTNLEKRIID